MKGVRRLLMDSLLMLNKIQNTRLTEELDSYTLASQIERYLERTTNKKEGSNASSATIDQ
jgi:hypothetical protein